MTLTHTVGEVPRWLVSTVCCGTSKMKARATESEGTNKCEGYVPCCMGNLKERQREKWVMPLAVWETGTREREKVGFIDVLPVADRNEVLFANVRVLKRAC